MRELLIAELMERYPYSRAWFKAQSIRTLAEMSVRKDKIKETTGRPSCRKEIDGQRLVLTECHGWQEEIN